MLIHFSLLIACIIPDNYTIVPPNNTYALPGDKFVIRVEHNMHTPSGLTNLTSDTTACAEETASTCILDVNQGLLNITDFQPYFAGSYQFLISYDFGIDDVCRVNFNLHEASKLFTIIIIYSTVYYTKGLLFN